LQATEDRDATADRANENGDDERPEVDLLASAEWMRVIRRPPALSDAVQEQKSVACINQGMHAFRQHCRTACDCGSDELRGCNAQIAGDGGVYDCDRATRGHRVWTARSELKSMSAGLFMRLGVDQADSLALAVTNIDVPVRDDCDRGYLQLVHFTFNEVNDQRRLVCRGRDYQQLLPVVYDQITGFERGLIMNVGPNLLI
jgi:hypothetical protein